MGSNLAPEKNLRLAVNRLHEVGRLIEVSRVYQSPASGAEPQPDFLNAAALVLTNLPLVDTRQQLREIEADLGRVRRSGAGVAIDLDLCLYGTEILSTSEITIPRPEILDYAFVAVPLAELAPKFLHPMNRQTLSVIANRLRQDSSLTLRTDVLLY